MIILTYDLCLLVTNNNPLNIVSMQTDDTVILRDEIFNKLESQKMIFKCKAKTELKRGTAITFNGCIATRNNDDVITVTQKE